MAKPKPQRVEANDCGVVIRGQLYFPHEGEWVELYAGMTVGEMHAIEGLRRLGVELQALQGEPGKQAEMLAVIDPQFDKLCELLADRVVDWNLADDRGRPLPKPDGTPEPFRRLRAEELLWLLAAAEGETPAQRKKDSRPSGTSSSATSSPAKS